MKSFIPYIGFWRRPTPEALTTQQIFAQRLIASQRDEIERLKVRLDAALATRDELQRLNTDLRTMLDTLTVRAMSDAFYRVLKSDNAR